MKIAVIGSRDPVLGFGLAGVKELYRVESREDAASAVSRCLQDPGIGIMLIEEDIMEILRDTTSVLEQKKNLYPVILAIPGSYGRIRTEPERRVSADTCEIGAVPDV